MDMENDGQETVSVTFEWTLRGLKNIFESTKGDSKSKVTKSPKFAGGRWQILFYANAGVSKDNTAEGGYVSLYLSCEPTTEEREAAISDSGRWVRDGVYRFTFELRSVAKTMLYNSKEASNHAFSHKTVNWGWAQFARRDAVYYQANSVKAHDAFIIICTITSTPAPPVPQHTKARKLVPADLIATVGGFLDDPCYSDVEFLILKGGQSSKQARSIYASRQMLERTEYFSTMFNSGFAEGASTPRSLEVASRIGSDNLVINEFDDSDEDGELELSPMEEDPLPHVSVSVESSTATIAENAMEEDVASAEGMRNVRAKLSHPSSPRSTHLPFISSQTPEIIKYPPKRKVIVKDFAYSTYFAVLFYIYTDSIIFAPLSSSFTPRNGSETAVIQNTAQPSTLVEPPGQANVHKRSLQQESATRREWIDACRKAHPERPEPCSAKSVYRLADLMGLQELRERASQHILKSLTVHNIAYEVFSPFAAAFGEIRRAQVDFFLTHWKEIRTSNAMRNVWKQIRNGRHPGFEEVWPVIASSLEFMPPSANEARSETPGDSWFGDSGRE